MCVPLEWNENVCGLGVELEWVCKTGMEHIKD